MILFLLLGVSLASSDYGMPSENARPDIVWKNNKTKNHKKTKTNIVLLIFGIGQTKKTKIVIFLVFCFCEKIEGVTEAAHMHNSEPQARVSSQKQEI